ncbi:phosphotransferase [Ruania zhangjianzhongii]|uniref:phosphotransferase n=1 Tax=Ruania zhangjianzhongii TaxID=2603206 RepID=UPI002467D6E8|nr:phosphotransferase [Ruania zhangjianzhongii]
MPENQRSPLALAALATVAIRGLDVVATRPPRNPGADFDVVGVMDAQRRRWIVRAPRTAAAGAALEGEVALLEQLGQAVDGGALRFQVPRPGGFAPLPEGGRAMVYRELVGAPIQIGALRQGPGLAAQLGRALASVHELDPALVADAGLPSYDAESYRQRRLTEVDEAARTGHVPAGLLRRWEHALENVALWRFGATPVHGDLAAEHLLVDDGDVTAILDWSEARVADPADDLAWLYAEAGDEALESILEAYALARTESTDDHLGDRALLAGELALARWLMHGVRTRDGQVIDEAIAMLGQLEVDLAGAAPIGHVEPVVEPVEPVVEPVEPVAAPLDDELVEDFDPAEDYADESAPDIPAEDTGPDEIPAEPGGTTFIGDDSDTAELRREDLRVPDYERRSVPRGQDDTPTTQLPPQSPAEED